MLVKIDRVGEKTRTEDYGSEDAKRLRQHPRGSLLMHGMSVDCVYKKSKVNIGHQGSKCKY